MSFPFFVLLFGLVSCLHFNWKMYLQLLDLRIFEPIRPMVLLQCLSGRHGTRMVVDVACLPSLFYEKARTLQRESIQALFLSKMDAFCYLGLYRLGS